MKICFVVKSATEFKKDSSTLSLVAEAVKRGHEVLLTELLNISLKHDGHIYSDCMSLSGTKFRSKEKFVNYIKNNFESEKKQVCLSHADAVFFRTVSPVNNIPVVSFIINISQILERKGVVVVNSPRGIIMANSKLYIANLPEDIRPKMIISMSKKDIKAFYKELGKQIIIKPLRGHGGESVFRVGKKTESNMNAIIEAVTKDDFAVVQEFISVKKKGDKRALLLNGKIIKVKNRHAIYFRKAPEDDVRSNVHVSGQRTKCKFTKKDEKICRAIGKQLVKDGLFFVGIDIIGDKLLEVNVMNPGGIAAIKELHNIDVSGKIITALERKAKYKNK